MKAGELPELNQARHDHLDIDVRRVMSEVDEAERFRPQFARAVITGAPIIDDRGVERRFVKLVLDKDAPVIGQRVINPAHAFKITFERVAKMLLTRKIPAVTDPNRMRLRAERFAEL